MDTGIITNTGLDIDQLFFKGAGGQTFELYSSSGVDIGEAYMKGSSELKTGIYTSKGLSQDTDIAQLLSSDAVSIRRTSGSWYSYVGGQGNTGAAYEAGFDLLDNYSTKMSEFIDVPATEYTGNPISYRSTSWHAFRVYSAFPDLNCTMDIKFTTTDGGNGTVTWSGVRTHSSRHKDFVIAGHGGDKGHYGEGLVQILLIVPGIRQVSYTGRFWINSD